MTEHTRRRTGATRRVLLLVHTGRDAARDVTIELLQGADRARHRGPAAGRGGRRPRARAGGVRPADRDRPRRHRPGGRLRARRGHRWRRVDPARRRGDVGRAGPRCSGSTSATSASWPRPRSTTSRTSSTPSSSASWTPEDRLTLDVRAFRDGELVTHTFALNEASVEKAARERMIEVVVEIDDRPLSRWGCDGVVLRDADRLDGLQLQRRRPDRLAGGRGAAHRADQRARPVRPAAGRGARLAARGRGHRPHRRRRGAVVRRAPGGRPAAGCPDRGTPRGSAGPAGPAAPGARSPTGWWPSSTSRSRAGAARPSAADAPRKTTTDARGDPDRASSASSSPRRSSSARG